MVAAHTPMPCGRSSAGLLLWGWGRNLFLRGHGRFRLGQAIPKHGVQPQTSTVSGLYTYGPCGDMPLFGWRAGST